MISLFLSQLLPFLCLIIVACAQRNPIGHVPHLSRSPPPDLCVNRTIAVEGGWCLIPHPSGEMVAPGRPLANRHYVADGGLAKVLAQIIPDGSSVIDIGAGIGQYQVWFMNNNKNFSRYLAYDGAPNVEAFTWGCVRYLNVAHLVHWYPHEISDWVISLEVGEHIPRQFESTFIHNLHHVNRKGMILSWAIIGQRGNGHVNCQSNEYIIKTVSELGYKYDEESSKLCRESAQYKWFKNTVMVFRRI